MCRVVFSAGGDVNKQEEERGRTEALIKKLGLSSHWIQQTEVNRTVSKLHLSEDCH